MEKILGKDLKAKLINELKVHGTVSYCCFTEDDKENYDEDIFTVKKDYIYLDDNKINVWASGYEYWIGECDGMEMLSPSYLTYKETDEMYEKLIEDFQAYDVGYEDYVDIEDDKYFNIEWNGRLGAFAIQTCEE